MFRDINIFFFESSIPILSQNEALANSTKLRSFSVNLYLLVWVGSAYLFGLVITAPFICKNDVNYKAKGSSSKVSDS